MKKKLTQIIVLSLFILSFNLLASAQKTVAPIVSLSKSDSDTGSIVRYGNLIGGVENGKFLDAKTTFGKLKGTEKFSLFDFTIGKKGNFSLGEIKEDSGACLENYYVEPQIEAIATLAVGTTADWQIVPRQPKKVSLTDANDKKSVAAILRLRGLPKSPVKIKQAFRIDLDGDGADEAVLVAHHYAEDGNLNAKIGSYSFVMIRKKIGGKTQNLFVGGTFFTKKTGYYNGEYSLSGIADLNGDGKMEIIAKAYGYEENWLKVFEMKAGKPKEIKALSYYCGA